MAIYDLQKLPGDIIAESKIVHADIYTSGAILDYQGKVQLSKGRNHVLFAGITEKADTSRVQLKFQGGITSCHLLGRQTRLCNPSEEVLALREEIAALESEQEALQIQYDAWKASASGSLLEASAANLSAYIESLPEKLKASSARRRFVTSLITEKKNALLALTKSTQSSSDQQVSLIVAEITAEADGLYPFRLSVEDPFAFWNPYYELSVESTEKPVQARLRASIRQSDSLDWEDISLTLLQGSMHREGTKPELNPLRVSFPKPTALKQAPSMNRFMGMAPGTMAQAMSMNALAEDTMLDGDTAAFEAPPAPQTEEVREMIAQYRLPGTYTIKSCDETLIDVLEQTLPVSYLYGAVPKLSPAVYLTATLKDPSAYHLIPCQAYVYYQQTNVGTVQIPETSVGDPLVLSLGKESSLVIERKNTSDEHSEALLKGTQTRKLVYTIELLNRKNTPVNVQISDQIPISAEDKIKVETLELSGGSLNAETGEVTWDIKALAPEKSCKLTLSYQIVHPKNTKLEMRTVKSKPSASFGDTVKFCPECGGVVPAGHKFCPTCGRRMI